MKLTNRSEYALLALALLARRYGEGLLGLDEIAKEQSIPRRFLQQILFTLKRAGYVRTQKGQEGGYCLAVAPAKVTIAEIVRLFEGALAPTDSVSKNFYRTTPLESEKGMLTLFSKVRDRVADLLENTTLKDVI